MLKDKTSKDRTSNKTSNKTSTPDCMHLQEGCDLDAGQACSDCVLLAESLAPAREVSRPMSRRLTERLRAIPATSPSERWIDTEEPDALDHRIHELLADTFQAGRRPRTMPPTLERSLRAIAQSDVGDEETPVDGPNPAPSTTAAKGLPWWIADSRWATAACALLTAALMLVAGDSSARFQDLQLSSSRFQKGASFLTTNFCENTAGERMADKVLPGKVPSVGVVAWFQPSVTPAISEPMSLLGSSHLGALGAIRDQGSGLWTAIRDRAAARFDPWIGRMAGRAEALNITAEAWLGASSKKNATLGPQQLRELALRAREAWNDSKPTPRVGR